MEREEVARNWSGMVCAEAAAMVCFLKLTDWTGNTCRGSSKDCEEKGWKKKEESKIWCNEHGSGMCVVAYSLKCKCTFDHCTFESARSSVVVRRGPATEDMAKTFAED